MHDIGGVCPRQSLYCGVRPISYTTLMPLAAQYSTLHHAPAPLPATRRRDAATHQCSSSSQIFGSPCSSNSTGRPVRNECVSAFAMMAACSASSGVVLTAMMGSAGVACLGNVSWRERADREVSPFEDRLDQCNGGTGGMGSGGDSGSRDSKSQSHHTHAYRPDNTLRTRSSR
jgi:hypothetical protein